MKKFDDAIRSALHRLREEYGVGFKAKDESFAVEYISKAVLQDMARPTRPGKPPRGPRPPGPTKKQLAARKRMVREFEKEHGPISEEEVAKIRRSWLD